MLGRLARQGALECPGSASPAIHPPARSAIGFGALEFYRESFKAMRIRVQGFRVILGLGLKGFSALEYF